MVGIKNMQYLFTQWSCQRMVVDENLLLLLWHTVILCFLLMCLTQICKYLHTLQIILCLSCRLKYRLRGRREVEEAVKFHPRMPTWALLQRPAQNWAQMYTPSWSHWALIFQQGKQAPSCPIFQIKWRKDASRASGPSCPVVMSSFRHKRCSGVPEQGFTTSSSVLVGKMAPLETIEF